MNIEEMKKNKFRNIVLVILFATIVILGLNNSVYASTATIKTISGKHTWNVTGTDYNYAKVIESVYNLSGENLKNQTIPSDKPELKPGFCIGETTGADYDNPNSIKNSFNVCSTIGNVDTSTYGDYFVQSVCIHPSKSLNTAAKTTYVQKVLFISKEQLTLYYTNNLQQKDCKSENVYANDHSDYFNKILQEAYIAKDSVNYAEHLRKHLADAEFHEEIKECGINNWELMTGNNYSTSCVTGSDEYNYYGIFIFVGTGDDGSQGRIIFNVYREKKSHPIKLSLEKQSFNGATSLGNAEIQVYDTDNGATKIDGLHKNYGNGIYGLVSGNDGKFGEIEIKPANYDAEKVAINIKEVKSPSGYFPINGEIELTISYDKNSGAVTNVEVPSEYQKYIKFDNGTVKLIIKNPKEPKYFLRKVNWDNKDEKIAGIKFNVTLEAIWKNDGEPIYRYNGEGETITYTTTKKNVDIISGKIKTLIKEKFDGTPIELWYTIEEIDNEGGYVNSFGKQKIGLKYDGNSITLDKNSRGTEIKDGEGWYVGNNGTTLVVKNKKVQPFQISLKKVDTAGTPIEGVSFIVEYDKKLGLEEDDQYEILKTDANGKITFSKIQPKTTDDFSVTIVESGTISKILETILKGLGMNASSISKSGYKLLSGPITINFTYDTANMVWKPTLKSENKEKVNITESKENKGVFNVGIEVENKSKIDKLTIFKSDSQENNTRLAGATFNIKLENIEDRSEENITTGNDGTLELKDLVIKDISKEVVIKITETSAPVGYKKLEGAITLRLKRKGDGYEYARTEKESTISDKEFVAGNIQVKNHEIGLDIKNIPIINLGGIVWNDGQTGVKENIKVEPNGVFDEGEGFSGVELELYKYDSKTKQSELIEKDVYGNSLQYETGAGDAVKYKKYDGTEAEYNLAEGEYVFPNLEKGEYYVKFLYDGINYKTVDNKSNKIYELTKPRESKATEEDRRTFDAKFKTITKGENEIKNATDPIFATDGQAKSADGKITTPLLYLSYDYEENGERKVGSKLSTYINGKNPATGNFDFQMKAKSENYLESNDSNWKGVWNADGTVKKDHYALDINCGLVQKYFDLSVGTDVKSARVTINGKEATYDYKQIMDGGLKDLDLDKVTQNNSSEKDGVEYTLYLYYSDYNFRIEDYKTDMTQGIKDTTSDNDHSVVGNTENKNKEQELEVYVTYSIILKNQSKQPGTVEKFEYYYDDKYISPTIEEMDDYDYAIDEANKKITFTHKGNSTLNEDNEYRKEIEVTFKVNKDSNGYVLKGDFSNAGEIIEYSTPNGGFIDDDSAPGNAVITTDNGQKKITHYEDDSDQAKGLEISVKEDKTRTIAGTVFEDANKNGSNDDNTPVNDVIVQLIELKSIKGSYYEYIWQQTRSGSNKVKTTSRNGYTGTEYTSDASGDETYQFKEFIPGNYIIRFIYGDGSTYDITPNVKKYNGQDYKSTIDNSYKEEWYNQANYNGKSVARDNEARRLEVMAYSTTINKEKGEAIDNKMEDMLNATWMCAETSKVNVAVEGDNTSYANMNFGLALRPQTKLTLEKHITGLKITPQGTGVQPIVDAKIVDGNIQGITTGLARIDSTRGNRGFWKVETDIEELAQGATVELEYTYTIKNESDEDYLSATLINEYKNLNSEEYAKHLSDIVDKNQGNLKNKVKGKTNTYGTYLGEYYYTGTKGSTDSEVLSTVNVIEDNLNNNLKLVEETDMKFEKVNNEAIEKTVYDDAGNEKSEKIETVIRNKKATETLAKDAVDSTRTAKLTTTLSSASKEISYPTYIGEIVEYTNAAGRKDMEATPGNLSYVHSKDTSKTMEDSNEHDEFWGETLIVSKPTGENKQAPMQIVIITISTIAVIGVGIILVKKYVLK